jgi:hypothetical protein
VLQVHAFHWFNRHLKGEEPAIEMAAAKVFEPEQLKVFPVGELPSDEINTTIQETFVPMAEPKVPESQEEWDRMKGEWITALKEKVFRAWPSEPEPLDVQKIFSATHDGIELSAYEYTSQGPWRLRLFILRRSGEGRPKSVSLRVLSQEDWESFGRIYGSVFPAPFPGAASSESTDVNELASGVDSYGTVVPLAVDEIVVLFAPRGIGPSAWTSNPRKEVHIRRRFMLLGQTLEGMRVFDVRRALDALGEMDATAELPIHLSAAGEWAAIALYASLFQPAVRELYLFMPPRTHLESPDLLNVLRFLEIPHALAVAAENKKGVVGMNTPFLEDKWEYPHEVAKRLDWAQDRLFIGK